MTKSAASIIAVAAMFGGLPEIKFSAKNKRSFNDRRPKTPPRSMTEAEAEYFAKHKTLHGYIQSETEVSEG